MLPWHTLSQASHGDGLPLCRPLTAYFLGWARYHPLHKKPGPRGPFASDCLQRCLLISR